MKKKTKLTLLLLSITVMMLAFGGSAHAAGKKAKALKAYDKFLSEKEKTPGSLFDTWGLAYLNNDCVPELLTYNSGFPATGKPCIYTYKKNKVVLVSLNASSCYYSHYYKKKGVVVSIYVPVAGHKDTSGFKGYYTCNFKKAFSSRNQNLIIICEKEGSKYCKPNKDHSEMVDISKSAFNKLIKAKVGQAKAKKVKYYKNTAKNRKKHLK